MAGRRKEADPVDDAAKAADESGIYLDPDLAKVRDEEIKALEGLPSPAPRGLVVDPEIDPVLVEAREAEIKRGDKKLV